MNLNLNDCQVSVVLKRGFTKKPNYLLKIHFHKTQT